MTDIAKRFSEAIAHAEGFYVAGSLPNRCHNPGDLALGDRGLGTCRSAGYGASDITVFSGDAEGWQALYLQAEHMLSGRSRVYRLDMSLAEVALKYAEDANWGVNVARTLGVAVTTTLGELANA